MVRNVLGGDLAECGCDPLTGYYRDGSCRTEEDPGNHAVCTVVTREFLEFSKAVGNDLSTPRPEFAFPGLQPGDRWCVVALRWLQAEQAGVAPPVVLAATSDGALAEVELAVLQRHAVDVPADPGNLAT